MADDYWRIQIADLEPTTFPDLTGKSSTSRPSSDQYNSAKQSLDDSCGRSFVATPSLYLATCAKILTTYSGEYDICLDFLSPSDQILPIRVTFESSVSNNQILSQIRHRLDEAQHHGPPSSKVLQDLFDSTNPCLSNVLVVIRNPPDTQTSFSPGLYKKYAFIFEFTPPESNDLHSSHVLAIHFRSSCLLFHDTPHVFAACKEAFVSLQHDQSLSFLSWTDNSSVQKSISKAQIRPADTFGVEVVHASFEKHAAERPDEIALDFLEDDLTRTQWTFSTLNSLANRIADKLISDYKVKIEDSIPINVSKSPAFYACVLGVLKAGGSFTPLAGSPPERKKFMLGELEAKVILCTDGQDTSWFDGANVFSVTSIIEQGLGDTSSCSLTSPPAIRSSSLCYQMYTSGSTGQPKAVSLEHQNAVQTACATRDLVPWRPKSRILQQAGVTFDMCYFETFFAWNVGICLCSAPDDLIYNKLTEVINDLGATLLGLTPSVALTVNPECVPGIEWLYCIGEALPQSLVDSWEGRLVNSYGPTEAAQMVTLFPVNCDVKSAVIGQPFENTSFTLLRNDSIETVPLLGVGELCIGGFQIARGYHKNPDKTEDSFIMLQGQRVYRTGDLVRMLGNGTFEYVSRMDDQVKIRGQRVELGEINKTIENSHRSVARATTQILKVNDRGKGQLVSFMVLRGKTDDHTQKEVKRTIEAQLLDRLPAYMVPKFYLFIEQIPLSMAGKINKRALTQIFRDSDSIKTTQDSSSSLSSHEMSQALKEIYGDFCGLSPDKINTDISIYQLGIDSISAIQIAHQLRAQNYHVQASDVLNQPSIAKMVTLLERKKTSGAHDKQETHPAFDYGRFDERYQSKLAGQCDISSTKIACVRPASPLQSAMVIQSAASSGSIYFNHLTYGLPEDVDIKRFVDAWEALISKHEILRSGFALTDDSELPVAMVTYHAGSLASPVMCSADQQLDLKQGRSRFTETAIKTMYLPPWQVLVSIEQEKFYFSAHHALYDAHVLALLMRDLALAYDGARLSSHLTFEPYLANLLPDHSARYDAMAMFWKSYGKSAVASKFPIMTPLIETDTSTMVEAALGPMSLAELEEGCRKSGITMQAAAQAAWGVLLAALTGEEVVTFGTVLSGRVTRDADEVSFPMITTVPTVVNAKATCSEILDSLLKYNGNVQQSQFVPLTKIQSLMGYGGTVLFDTIFTFQKRSPNKISTKTKFNFMDNDLAIEYPISVELEPVEHGGLNFSVFYQSKYMHSEQAQLLVKQYHFILQQIICKNDTALRPAIVDADQKLFSITPAAGSSLPSEHTLVHHTVENKAQYHPDKVAFEFVTSLEESLPQFQQWSFADLNIEGNKMAQLLHKHSVSQGSIVAICFEKCPEAAFAMLGILKAGCAFVALDPGAPAERKRFIMQDSEASILLTKGSLAADLSQIIPVTIIDLGVETIAHLPTVQLQLDRPIDPQEMAYCLYTSGTTGTPKGCVVTHENVIQVLCCFEKLYAYTEKSRWLQFASYHFDVSVMEHFWSWFVGITVVKASRDLVLQDLSNAISVLKITHIDLTPSLARLLDPIEVPTLAGGVFVTGGEMLRNDIIEAWGSSGAIHNAYGPTEATIGVTMYCHVPTNGRPSNIGWPFRVVGVMVVDPLSPTTPVLRGAVGELLVFGKLVAKGYLRRDDLTTQRFIDVAGHRCYRTGDLVRILSDGSIEFLGRADDQIKLRGQRLEIGEINSVIKQRDHNVDDVSTLVLKHPKQQKEQLVSFVATRELNKKQAKLTLHKTKQAMKVAANLRSGCMEKLPGYMVPTHILLVNKMPLSPNNKIDNKQLKSLYESTDPNTLQRVAAIDDSGTSTPANEEDIQKVSEVLFQTLHLDSADLSPSSSFFELGLDSISVISLSRTLKAAGYKNASASVIMNNPTIARLSHTIAQTRPQEIDGSVQAAHQKIYAYNQRYKSLVLSTIAKSQGDLEQIMPCTSLQAGMIARSLEFNRGLYFAAFSFDLHANVNTGQLKQACQRVCDTVQMLRTKFIPTDEGYIQFVLRNQEVPWTEQESIGGDEELDNTLQNAYQQWWKNNQPEILRPFEIIITKRANQKILTVHIFHALYDGISLPLIMDRVVNEYYGNTAEEHSPSFSEAMPYGPLREPAGAKEFWLHHLSELDHSSTSGLRALSTRPSRHDTCVVHRIEPINGLEDCRRKLNVTHQAMIQACWATLLQDVMGGPLVLGLIVSGRSIDLDGAEGVIGPLFNTIPFLITLKDHDTWEDIISKCHKFNSSALTYQHTPLRDIQRWTRKYRTESSLFDSLLVFQKEIPQQTVSSAPWTHRDETFEADYPLALEVKQTLDQGFNLTLACQAHMSDEQASKELLHRFDQMLRQMIGNVGVKLSEVVSNQSVFEYSHGAADSSHTQDSRGEKTPHPDGNGVMNGHSDKLQDENSNGSAKVVPEGISKSFEGSKFHNQPSNGKSDIVGNISVHTSQPQLNGNARTRLRRSLEVISHVREEISALANLNKHELNDNTSMFEIGLDSIDAVKLSSRLKKKTSVQVPVSQIMRALTVEKIAALIEDKGGSKQDRSETYDLNHSSKLIEQSLRSSGLDLSGVERILPCTPLQEGMVADMLNSDFERYLNFDVLKLNKGVDVAVLKAAWMQVVEQFPILRTTFVEVVDPEMDYTFAQVVTEKSTLDIKEVTVADENNFTELYQSIREDVKSTFHSRPALRLTLAQNSENYDLRYLILTLPHAMYDGWSLGLIHDAVRKAYHHESIEVKSYEAALSSILNSSGRTSTDFWRHTLSDTQITIVPSRQNGTQIVSRSEITSRISLSDIKKFCRQNRVTLSALCQAVWSVVLAYHTGQLDVAFAQVLSGRTDELANNVVFPTMNTVVSRTILHGSRSQIVQHIQEVSTSISEHQHFPLRKALALASNSKDRAIFNTLFIFQKSARADVVSQRSLYSSIDSASNVEYPICVEAEVATTEIVWRTACENSYFDQDEIEDLLERLDVVLGAIVHNPDKSIVDFADDKMRLCDLPAIAAPQQKEKRADRSDATPASDSNTKWPAMEQTIREIVASVGKLDESEVNKQSSLLGLGLDSISTIKVSSLLRKQGVKVNVKDLLSAGSIEQIAKLSSNRDPADNFQRQQKSHASNIDKTNGAPDLQPSGIDVTSLFPSERLSQEAFERVIPVTAGQMLLLSRWQNEGVYYSSLDFSIGGCDDISKIQSAWSTVLQQIPMLRTIFLSTGNSKNPVLQAELKNVQPLFELVSSDTSLEEAANQTSSIDTQIIRPPCALFAKETSDNSFALALKISHALYDGFSLKMIIGAFQELIRNPNFTIPSIDYTFSNYLATSASSDKKRDFWVEYLSDVKVFQLPATRSETMAATRNHIVRANVLHNLVPLRTSARKNHVSVQSLLLANYAIVHAQRLQQHYEDQNIEDVLIGIFMANRNIDAIDELAAPTLGFAPVKVKWPLTRSALDIARDIQIDLADISEDNRGQVGLWELQNWIGAHIKVDVWINILRHWVPDTPTENDGQAHVVTGEKSEDLERQYEIIRCDENVAHGLLLKNNMVRHCYDYPMMDLEATIKDDNIDIGIQAPNTLLDMETAAHIIKDVAARLDELGELDLKESNGHT